MATTASAVAAASTGRPPNRCTIAASTSAARPGISTVCALSTVGIGAPDIWYTTVATRW